MLKLTSISNEQSEYVASLTLPFEHRQKARLHTTLDDGQEVGLFLPRGLIIRGGDILLAETGERVKVISADEKVSTVSTIDSLLLARACYHLGNRHVPIQISNSWIRYLHDHVLDEMIEGLGLSIKQELAPFEPEPGAYSSHYTHAH